MKPADFIRHVENTLGWAPAEDEPRWKATARESAKLVRKIKTKPHLYTWDNLMLTVELLRRERAVITSPVAVCTHVRRALDAQYQVVTSDIAGAIHAAITEAFTAGEQTWVERLARASGDARHEVLAEWNQHHADAN